MMLPAASWEAAEPLAAEPPMTAAEPLYYVIIYRTQGVCFDHSRQRIYDMKMWKMKGLSLQGGERLDFHTSRSGLGEF
jgi:hypothetical protein